MAALSTGYHKEHKTSQGLYLSARLSVTKYLGSSRAWTTEQPIWLIQSILILMALGTTSGKVATFNEALSWASLLANAVRSKKTPDFNAPDNDTDLLTTWERWIEYETVVRTKAAAFCFLSNLNVCFNVAPTLLNCEMNNKFLPSEETEWRSHTPESWLENRNHSPRSPIRFLEALDYLLSPTPQPLAVRMSSFGIYVMLHAIVQRMWRFQQDMWSINSASEHLSISYVAVQKWHEIAQSMKALSITISSSSIPTALHAIKALRSRVKMGMALKSWGSKSPHSVQVHLVSIECCLFSSAWMREVSTRPEIEWAPEERECVRLVRETLGEVELDPEYAKKTLLDTVGLRLGCDI
ncbi:hypothetical protein DL98DRAFT_539433 [Cadophora sp. DSE1049]|nr:hypothetical protein DL98DRAFT_539433 [Cadophora sp. DSE1049]